MQSRKRRRVDEVAVISSVRAGYVYSITGWAKTRRESRTLICTGPDVYMKWLRVSTLLILTVQEATILAGCGGAGSGGSSQAPEEQQESRSDGSTEQKPVERGS